ncbi:hypothetical protein GmHk_18G052411 [Glycine max]|nr:hypothetical protein GmHk_18G052411 [Glycine max]
MSSVQDSLEEQASQGSFVPYGCQDVLIAAIGRPKHPGCVRVVGAAARASIKESCVDPSKNDPDTGDSDKYGLYIEENPSCLVALGRVYEGSITIHNIPLLHDQVKVGVEEVKDADAPVHVPTNEVMWDATVFGVFNEDFPLYIKHEDLSEIAHGGQCLNISIIQLWILALKGLDDTPQPKSKAGARWIVKSNRQKGNTECGYYVMLWMSTIILGTFRNNWETIIVYFKQI